MLKNTNQCGNKNNRTQHAEENEGQPFFTHTAKDEIRPFGRKFKQRFKETGDIFNNKKSTFCMQEKECQRDFNNNQLYNKTNANFSAVETHQPGKRKNNHQRQQEMDNLKHGLFSVSFRGGYLATALINRKWAFSL